MGSGLTRRMVIASGLLVLMVGAAFVVLIASIAHVHESERRARQSEEVLVVANRLERLVIDMETGLRGFVITGQESFLQPWQAAQVTFPLQARTLERLTVGNPAEQALVRQIAQGGGSYDRDYAAALIDAARRDRASARTVQATEEGKRRIDVIRAEFDRFVAIERDLARTRERRSEAVAHRAVLAASAGLAGSILLIVAFAGYLTRAVVHPVRRVADMAGRLATGDLGVRLPQRGVGEIGVLERDFNTMARSLEESRRELAASRARIVAAGDQTRRRIERDLHDGTQQRLVSLVLDLRAVEAALPPGLPEVGAQLARVAEGMAGALDDLREISRGIHPAILSEGGLAPAIKALARRSAVPVELDVDVPRRLPEQIEVAAYYAVSEGLANAAKHARATVARVEARMRAGDLHLSLHDDGPGGATTGDGSGLIGLTDRIEALGGTITITSPPGHGTTLVIELPVTR